jgi:hypothetical protein
MNINQFGASIIEGLDTGTFAPYSDAPDNTFPPYTPTPTASVPYTPTLTTPTPYTPEPTTYAQTTARNTTAAQTTSRNTTAAQKTAAQTTAAQTTARNTTAAPKNGEILTLLTRNNISSEILETFPFTKEDVQLWASTLPNKANTSPSITSDTILINIFDPKIVEFIKKNKDAFQTFLGNDQRGDKKIADVDAQNALYDYYIEIDKYFILQDNNIDAITLNEKRKSASQDAIVTYKSQYLNLFNIVFGILFVIGFIFIFMRTTFQPAIDSVKNSASGTGSMIWNSIKGIGSLPGKILSSGPVKYIATIPGKIMSLFRKKPNNIQNAAPAANP